MRGSAAAAVSGVLHPGVLFKCSTKRVVILYGYANVCKGKSLYCTILLHSVNDVNQHFDDLTEKAGKMPNKIFQHRKPKNRKRTVNGQNHGHGYDHAYTVQFGRVDFPCVENGVDVKSLSEIMGHSDVKITLQRYVHPSMETKKAQVNKLPFLITDGRISGQEKERIA
ncbi:MAG: hypothetical protein LUD78_00015 [Clostridiales bacterium]|nr:hypothetical protein [Clostridiales bacterium]